MYFYYVDNGYCYTYINKIIETSEKYFVAEIMWFTRPGKIFIIKTVERIPYKSFFEWKCDEMPSDIFKSLA